MKLLYVIVFIFLFADCNNSGDDNKKTEQSHADSLMHEIMKGHDFTMARIDRMDGTEKKIQQTIDSISRLPAAAQKNSADYKIQLDSVLNRLKLANGAMDKWMNEFNMDSSLNNMEQRIKYLESERIKISAVKDSMISSLQTADSLLKKK